MPNDLSISAVGPVIPVSSRTSQTQAAPRPNPTAERVLPNPSLRLEAALGLVVIEFRNDRGTIETSYPSERQLAAYRANELAGRPVPDRPGVAPPGATAIGTGVTAATSTAADSTQPAGPPSAGTGVPGRAPAEPALTAAPLAHPPPPPTTTSAPPAAPAQAPAPVHGSHTA